eukprot:2259793-Ditylum_brightwellii.AAC.1
MRKLFKFVQQCEIFSVANLKTKILTKLEATATQHEMAEEKQTARKAIITLLTKRILVTAVRKREMSVTEKCSDRSWIKLIHTDTEKHTALFAEKIGVWNTRSLQGSVGIHCSANMYGYRSMKDIRYRSYTRWKITGIPNPKF